MSNHHAIRYLATPTAIVVGLFCLLLSASLAPPAQAQCHDYGAPGSDPTLIQFDLFPDSIADVAMQGDLAWLALSDYGGIAAVDMTDPFAPQLVSRLALPVFETYQIAVSGDVAVLSYSNWTSFGLVIVDITDPEAPELILDYDAPTGWIYGVAVRDTTLYAVLPNPGTLQVFDIADPSAPQIVGQLTLGYGAGSIALDGDLALVPFDATVEIVDIAVDANPTLLGTIPIPAPPGGGPTAANCVATAGTWTVVGVGGPGLTGGLQIFDTSDPSAPVATGSVT